YLGEIVDTHLTETVIGNSLHPYTQSLIAAVPVPDPASRRTGDVLSGEIPSPVNPPPGCRFHTRCPYAHMRCTSEPPRLVDVEPDHKVACHLYDGVSPSVSWSRVRPVSQSLEPGASIVYKGQKPRARYTIVWRIRYKAHLIT